VDWGARSASDTRIADEMNAGKHWRVAFDWSCPACGRSLAETIRWLGETKGWFFRLEKHHDHSPLKRFPRTLICGECNGQEAELKTQLKLGEPSNWSLSPEELRRIFIPRPHAKSIVRRDLAFVIARQIQRELRADVSI
jgi:hypothetical protein